MIITQNAAAPTQLSSPPLMLTLPQTLEADAAQMQARAAELSEQYSDGETGQHRTAQQLQKALQDAACQSCRAADALRRAAMLEEVLAKLETLPDCPRNYQLFGAATLETLQDFWVWRGADPIPTEGQRIRATMNGLGPGQVRGYFVAGEPGGADSDHPHQRFLGVAVDLESPPAWYVNQNARTPDQPAYLFGGEIAPLT